MESNLQPSIPHANDLPLREYYSRRAQEYEKIYDVTQPDRRQELFDIENYLRDSLSGKMVLEIACGTGYWTERIASVVQSLHSTDWSEEMLAIAKNRTQYSSAVTFQQADAYNLPDFNRTFDAAIAGFWISHVPSERLHEFLGGLHRTLIDGATVIFFDNNNVAGIGGEAITIPGDANSYKKRILSDGSEHIILKNYFVESELRELFAPYSSRIKILHNHWYWFVEYILKKS